MHLKLCQYKLILLSSFLSSKDKQPLKQPKQLKPRKPHKLKLKQSAFLKAHCLRLQLTLLKIQAKWMLL